MRRCFSFARNNNTNICHCQWILRSYWRSPSICDKDPLRRSRTVVNISATTIRSSLNHLAACNDAFLPFIQNSEDRKETKYYAQRYVKLLGEIHTDCPSINTLRHHCNILMSILYLVFYHAWFEAKNVFKYCKKSLWEQITVMGK